MTDNCFRMSEVMYILIYTMRRTFFSRVQYLADVYVAVWVLGPTTTVLY
jgi:hypothetical protein